MNNVTKKLECLFAWSDFYKQNQRWDDWAKAQQQIDEFKRKHNIK
jgi:hypothetical protein